MSSKSLSLIVSAIAGLAFQAAAQTAAPQVQTVSSPSQPDPLSRAAATYATYQGDVTDVKSKGFNSAGDIDKALSNLGGHNSDQFTQGWMAYSALVAAQTPEFRAAVLDIEGYYGRDTLMTGLKNDVRYARTLNGGSSAVSSSLSAVSADSRRLVGAAAYVKEQAYSLQGAGWAKGKIGDSSAIADGLMASSRRGIPARGSMITALSSGEINTVLTNAGRSGSPSVWESVSSAANAIRVPEITARFGTGKRIARGKEPIADSIATLAAYRILEADAASTPSIRTTMTERQTAGCVNMAQLNLQQCVAAAHKHYEIPFCIGEHALSDIGQCIGGVAQ